MSTTSPHRRYNPLLKEWVMVSPHRNSRPWKGQKEPAHETERSEYDETCYLCPGNTRAQGDKNPTYSDIFVFTNDFQAIMPETGSQVRSEDIFRSEPITGTCRVICFSPKHNISLAEMSVNEIYKVISVWKEQLGELGKSYQWPQVFENKGTAMGCSNLHPHGQVWASNTLPTLVEKEDSSQRDYFKSHNEPLLEKYAKEEILYKERVVFENDDWVVLVPFWAVWPFETMVIPKNHHKNLVTLSQKEHENLSHALKTILVKYDNLFETSFPYSMGLHGEPFNSEDNAHWQFHIHFYPPLLRSANVKKFMVGYELLAQAQRDMTPEQAAAKLRETVTIHYKQKQ